MKKFTVDRLEGDRAVLECENGDTAVFDRKSLPGSIREGDVLCFEEGSCYLNAEETERRSQRIKELMDRLLAQNSGR